MKALIILMIILICSERITYENVKYGYERDIYNIKINMEVDEMSILGSVLKVAGTIVEGCGKTICDCVKAVEEERANYINSDEYKADKAHREEMVNELKSNWNTFCENNKEVVNAYKKYTGSKQK